MLDPSHALFTAQRNDVGLGEIERGILPWLLPAHCDDLPRAHLLRSQYIDPPDRAVADNNNSRALTHARRLKAAKENAVIIEGYREAIGCLAVS
jgi:hypothetical protein